MLLRKLKRNTSEFFARIMFAQTDANVFDRAIEMMLESERVKKNPNIADIHKLEAEIIAELNRSERNANKS